MTRRAEPPIMVSAVVDRSRQGMLETLIGKIPTPPHDGKWTFPSGPAEQGETPESALRRTLERLLGIKVRIVCAQPPFDHTWDEAMCRWRFFFCDGSGCEVKNEHYLEVRWVPRASLREYDFDPVSQQVANWLLSEPDQM
jgi:8-oxo-dGTP diphosphatase